MHAMRKMNRSLKIVPGRKVYDVVISRDRKSGARYESYDFDVIAEYCPTAVSAFLKSKNSRGACRRESLSTCLDNARKHLSAIGWKFWSKIKKGKDEWRYISPKSNKIYYSMNTVCKAIDAGEESNTRDPNDLREVGCGDEQIAREPIRSREKKKSRVRKRKRKRIDWSSSSSESESESETSDEEVSDDDDRVVYGNEVSVRRPSTPSVEKDVGFRLRKRKKISCPSSSSFESEEEIGDQAVSNCRVTNELNDEKCSSEKLSFKIKLDKGKVLGIGRSSSDSQIATRNSRSCKRVRHAGPCKTMQVPKTVLSWLIENNAVVPRSKVYYCKGSGTKPLAEGRIASDGIRCGCCQSLFSLSKFQAHVVGNNIHRPAENIYFGNGKSLVSCQLELIRKKTIFSGEIVEPAKESQTEISNDIVCSVCQYGGELILCDRCPSSFHASCLGLTGIPEGNWFCPSCCCGTCGNNQVDNLLCCHQCERRYHAHCKNDREMANPGENWFCCKTCEKMHCGLQQLLGKPILVGQKNLTCTLVKPMKYEAEDKEDCDLVAVAENCSKLSVALEVMHECFEPVKDLQTKRDLVEDVLFCRESNLNRLNFKGFYTVLLERNDELIAVALVRIHGEKVAEIPLIGTRFQHRRLGMCRVLMHEIEKTLLNLGVQQLVLPAAPSIVNTWTSSFGFSVVTKSEKSGFLGYTFLDFQDTIMCQKLLRKPPPPRLYLSRNMSGVKHQPQQLIEKRNSMSENSLEQREGSETVVVEGAQVHDALSPVVIHRVFSNQDSNLPCSTLEIVDHKNFESDKSNEKLKFFTGNNSADLITPAPQTNYVSCR